MNNNEGENKKVCLGVFTGAHGVKGDATIKTFTSEPKNIAAYGTLESEDGRRKFTIKFIRTLKNGVALVRADEIAHREDALSLSGEKLFIARKNLPAPDQDEFYLEDLIGLQAVDQDGAASGTVSAVFNFGAGDLIELKNVPDHKGAVLVPFTKEAIPDVDLTGGTLTVNTVFLPTNEKDPTNEGQ